MRRLLSPASNTTNKKRRSAFTSTFSCVVSIADGDGAMATTEAAAGGGASDFLEKEVDGPRRSLGEEPALPMVVRAREKRRLVAESRA